MHWRMQPDRIGAARQTVSSADVSGPSPTRERSPFWTAVIHHRFAVIVAQAENATAMCAALAPRETQLAGFDAVGLPITNENTQQTEKRR